MSKILTVADLKKDTSLRWRSVDAEGGQYSVPSKLTDSPDCKEVVVYAIYPSYPWETTTAKTLAYKKAVIAGDDIDFTAQETLRSGLDSLSSARAIAEEHYQTNHIGA